MSTRASIIIWSAGSAVLLGLMVDAVLVGILMVASAVVPSVAPRQLPKWAAGIGLLALAAVPLVAGVLGYLEGRLKVD